MIESISDRVIIDNTKLNLAASLTLVKDGFAGVVDTSKKFFYCVNQ
jgi:hypothetical protein